MLFINNFFNKNKNSESIKINLIIKNLLIEYKIKDANIIYIIESYNKQSVDILTDKELINNGRKKLIIEINKIKDKEYGIHQVLLNNLVKNLIEKNIEKNNFKNILENFENESLKITNNNNLIKNYKNILFVKLIESF